MAEHENNNINEFNANQEDAKRAESVQGEVLEKSAMDENDISALLDSLNPEDGEEDSKAPEAVYDETEQSDTNELLKELAQEDSSYLEQGDVKVKRHIKKSVVAVIVCAVIVAAAVVAGLLIWANPSHGGKSGNTLGNLANYGYAVTDGEWTYFTALSSQSAGEDAASSASDSTDTSSATISIFMTNGKEEKTLVEKGGTYLNVSGSYVYYLGYSDGYVYRVKKDGTNISQLNSVQCSALQVKGSYLYYVSASDGAVYSMRTDGGKTTKISPDGLNVYQIAVEDNGIYYVSQTDTLLYKADFDFSNPIVISDKAQATRFTIEGDSIYYTVVNENYVESTDSSDVSSSKNTSSKQTSSKSDSSDTSSNVSSGTSSGSDSSEEPEIITYRADKDGGNPKKVLENALCPLVVDNYIFYSDLDGNICRADLNGDNSKKFEHMGQLFSRGGDLLYYICADKESEDYGYVYKINIDGTDPRKV